MVKRCSKSPYIVSLASVKRFAGNEICPVPAAAVFTVAPESWGWTILVQVFESRKGKQIKMVVTAASVKPNQSRKRSRKAMRRNPRTYGMSPALISRFAPFDAACSGAKIPDECTYPTVSFSITNRVTAVPGGTNAYAIAFCPSSVSEAAVAAQTAADGVSWLNAGVSHIQVSQLATLRQNFSVWRNVGWGVRIFCQSPITSVSGVAYISVVPWSLLTTLTAGERNWWSALPATAQAVINSPWHYEVPATELCTDGIIIPGRIIDDSYSRFRSYFTNYSSTATPGVEDAETVIGHSIILIYLQGASAGNVFVMESIRHIEAIANPVSLGYDSRPEPYSPEQLEVLKTADVAAPVGYSAKRAVASIWQDVLSNASVFASQAASVVARGALRGITRAGMSMLTAQPAFRPPFNRQLRYGEPDYMMVD